MPQDPLNEREFELVNIIGHRLVSNQRDLSQHLDISLGLVNMLIRRLIAKGYIRIHQLNKRKAEYILTPKGLTEKMRKAVKYTMKTIQSISLVQNRLKEVLSELVKNGEKDFFIFGESDFSFLVEIVLKDVASENCAVNYFSALPESWQGTLLICSEIHAGREFTYRGKFVNLVEELAKDYFVQKQQRSF